MNSDDKIRTLSGLIATMEVLQARFERRFYAINVNTALYTHRELLKGETVTITGIARLCGVPKSSVSTLLHRVPHVILSDNPVNGRSKIVTLDDLEERTQYLVDVEKSWTNLP